MAAGRDAARGLRPQGERQVSTNVKVSTVAAQPGWRAAEPGPDETLTRELGSFVAGLPSASVREDVITRVKLHILDTLGCQIAFADLPWSRDVARYARACAGGGRATVVRSRRGASAQVAAMVNASCAHGFEMDDTHLVTTVHPGAVVVPAALAVGQVRGASGRRVIAAVIAGYETMIRVALGATGMMDRGLHATALAGPFGAAAAVSVLEGLDAGRAAHALGIAASRASGIAEYTLSGGSVKRAHAGFAAQAGIESAWLAREGITAPARALEGRKGLLRAVSDHPDPAAVTEGLGHRFHLLGTGLKPYCCCAGQHTVIDAVTALKARIPERGEVEAIHVYQNPREVAVVGGPADPVDVTSAQFSAPFGIALRLMRGGNGYSDYRDVRFDDPALLGIARKVVYHTLDRADRMTGEAPCRVEVVTRSGEVLREEVRFPRGSARRPMTSAEVRAKFMSLCEGVLRPGRARALADMLLHLEAVADVSELAAQLAIDGDLDSET